MRNKQKKQWMLPFLAVFLLAAAVVGLLIWMEGKQRGGDRGGEAVSATEVDYHTLKADGKEYQYNTSRVNFLFVGVDSSTDAIEGQADTILLVTCDRSQETMDVISFSRDSMLPIQVFDASGKNLGWENQHLGLAFSYGETPEQGCMLTAEAVSRSMNSIPVIYYTAANISSITDFQNLVGPLTVTVPGDDLEYLGEEYKKGASLTLDTSNVETFLRTRNTGESYTNSSRMERQRTYINAYLNQLKKRLEENFDQTVDQMSDLSGHLVTNISLDEISAFSEMLMTYSFSEDRYHVVEGTDQKGMFHDEYIIEEDALKTLLLDLFYVEKGSGSAP